MDRPAKSTTLPRTPVSNTRKAGLAAGILAKEASKNRWIRASVAATTSVLSSVGKIIGTLWLQTTGLFFLVFSLIGGGAAIREYGEWTQTHAQGDKNSMMAGVGIFVVFGYFAATSFWKARKR